MRFIELAVRTAKVIHGFDTDNNVIEEVVSDDVFMTKLISVERIQSVSEQYLLVTSSHGRVMYWEYDSTLDELKETFRQSGILI